MKVIGTRDEPCTSCGREIVYVTVDLSRRRRPSRARSGPATPRRAGRLSMGDLIDENCNWPPAPGPTADYGEG